MREDDGSKSRDGRVSRYAWGRDYHKVIGNRLRRIVKRLAERYPDDRFRVFTDTLPIAERHYAQKAGLGFVGRNTLLITRTYGSWVFLGGILSTHRFEPTPPSDEIEGMRCPSGCTRCIDVCPTDALFAPHKIDASKCISYLTIERRGALRREQDAPASARTTPEWEKSGNWVFGCDLCQEVCPFNLKAVPTDERDFTSWIAGPRIDVGDLLAVESRERFFELFAGSPLMRPGRNGMIRNALIAAWNSGFTKIDSYLERLESDDEPAIRESARVIRTKLGERES